MAPTSVRCEPFARCKNNSHLLKANNSQNCCCCSLNPMPCLAADKSHCPRQLVRKCQRHVTLIAVAFSICSCTCGGLRYGSRVSGPEAPGGVNCRACGTSLFVLFFFPAKSEATSELHRSLSSASEQGRAEERGFQSCTSPIKSEVWEQFAQALRKVNKRQTKWWTSRRHCRNETKTLTWPILACVISHFLSIIPPSSKPAFSRTRGSWGFLHSFPAVIGGRRGLTLDKSPVYRRAT